MGLDDFLDKKNIKLSDDNLKRSLFEAYISRVASIFKKLSFSKVKLISHLDADGISSVSIIIKMLERMNVSYEWTTVLQLNEKFMYSLSQEHYDFYIFSDVGSGMLNEIVSHFKGRNSHVFILDHHRIKGDYSLKELESFNIYHVNPHHFDIDGAIEISAAGVCFLFAKDVNLINSDLAYLALIGALGDVQEKQGFHHFNKKILDLAVKNNIIEIKKTLNFFGQQTRPIKKLISSGTNFSIPSITGNINRTFAFLNDLDIDPNKRYYELSAQEILRLENKIKNFREDYFLSDDIYIDVYLLKKESYGTVFKDAREFSTLLNACGRLNKPELGIGSCLNDNKLRSMALENLNSYKFELINALNYYESNKKSFISEDDFVIVNAKNNISPNIVGPLASILARSKFSGQKKYVLTMARNNDNTSKISVRYSDKNPVVNLRDILAKIVKEIGGESGGHDSAAGAIIEQKNESLFIERFLDLVSSKL